MEFRNTFPKSKTTGTPVPGHLMLFQYGAKTAEKLRYYDRNPLCYIIAVQGRVFWGLNLHYTKPQNRKAILSFIDQGGDFTKLSGYNKYLRSYVQATFLDLSASDMEKAAEMGLEDFLNTIGGRYISTSPFLPSFYK